ncbi:MAG: hypothetical protein IPK87_02125 [Planctomycetes bacterium]|nr:hypothetical protein [Planctomycetota bacterium]
MAQGRKSGLRMLVSGFLGRFVRRGFFRIVLLMFLVGVVLPFVALQAIANRSSANTLLEEVVSQVFDLNVADVIWDKDRTTVSGPDLALTGKITYHNVRIHRRAGATPHPARAPLDYDFVTVPRVEISFDLKKLPSLPVTRVELPEGLTLYFNIHKGTWIDQTLFKPAEGGGAPPELPQIILHGKAQVFVRADGILVPPETLPAGKDWYDFTLENLGLLPHTLVPDSYRISGSVYSKQFGDFELDGSVARNGQRNEVLFRTYKPLPLDRTYAAVLAPDVRQTVEQFSISAKATLAGRLLIESGKDLRFDADINAYDGEVCFVGFPLRVTDVSADVQVRNNNITVDAIGRRGSADVRVVADVTAVGSATETIRLTVNIDDLLVDEEFRLALLNARLQPDNMDYSTGLPYPADEFDPKQQSRVTGYPEWQGPTPWDGGLLYPDLADVFPFISRAFCPIGLADFELRLNSQVKGIDPVTGKRRIDEELNWKVFVRDATACFVGLPEQGPGFPIPLHNVYGVVEGKTAPSRAGTYEVRGYTPEELARLAPDAAEGKALQPDGLTGTLENSGERVWVLATFVDDRSPGREPRLTLKIKTEGVDFNDSIQSRLPPNVRDVVEPFAPAGKVDIQSATLTIYPSGEDSVDFNFTLVARSVAAQYQFPGAAEPARFREVAGTITVRKQSGYVELSNMRGTLADSRILMSLKYRDDGIPEFSIESEDFAIKPELQAILPPGVAEVLKRFEPRGFVRIKVTGNRGTSTPDFMKADITFLAGTGDRNGSVRFDKFPYVLTDVQGRLFVTVKPSLIEVMIRDFTGVGAENPETGEKAAVEISGHVLVPYTETAESPEEVQPPPADELPIVDISVRATRLPIDAQLLTALTPIFKEGVPEGQKPRMIEFVEELNTVGTVGVNGRLIVDDKGEMDWRFEINLEGTGLKFKHFPLPIEALYGSVIIDGREVRMRNVTGRAETGSMTLHEAGYTDADGWWVSISGRELDFTNPTLRRALPEALRNSLGKLNPVGMFDVDVHLSGKDEYMSYQLSLDTRKIAVDLGLHFDDMTARFDVEGMIEGDVRRMNGSVFIKEVFFKKARFDRVTSSVQYFGDRLEFPNLRGYFYDGWLEGRFGMEGDDYAGEVSIRAADLKQLGETAFPDAGELLGAMDAEVRFYSKPDADGQIGRGRVDVQPFNRSSDDPARNTCKLAPVPLFNTIAAVTGSESNFDEGHVFFWLGEDRITIREMDFVSDGARIETFGGDDENYIMYGTAQMRMKLFFTLAPRSPIPLPLLQEVLDLLKQILFPLYVTGTLNEPNVEPFSLSVRDIERAQDRFPRRPEGG